MADNGHAYGIPITSAKVLRVKLELPPHSDMGSVLDNIDVGRVQELCRSELHKDESWCVLYCGAVAVIRAALTSACTKSRFHYAEESFNW